MDGQNVVGQKERNWPSRARAHIRNSAGAGSRATARFTLDGTRQRTVPPFAFLADDFRLFQLGEVARDRLAARFPLAVALVRRVRQRRRAVLFDPARGDAAAARARTGVGR